MFMALYVKTTCNLRQFRPILYNMGVIMRIKCLHKNWQFVNTNYVCEELHQADTQFRRQMLPKRSLTRINVDKMALVNTE